MNNPFVSRLSLDKPAGLSLQGPLTGHVQKLQPASEGGVNFRNVLSNTLSNVNGVLQQPDALMKDALTTGNVDVHDVMIANAKAELAVNVTAQVATKVIQAYDRILQIQL